MSKNYLRNTANKYMRGILNISKMLRAAQNNVIITVRANDYARIAGGTEFDIDKLRMMVQILGRVACCQKRPIVVYSIHDVVTSRRWIEGISGISFQFESRSRRHYLPVRSSIRPSVLFLRSASFNVDGVADSSPFPPVLRISLRHRLSLCTVTGSAPVSDDTPGDSIGGRTDDSLKFEFLEFDLDQLDVLAKRFSIGNEPRLARSSVAAGDDPRRCCKPCCVADCLRALSFVGLRSISSGTTEAAGTGGAVEGTGLLLLCSPRVAASFTD